MTNIYLITSDNIADRWDSFIDGLTKRNIPHRYVKISNQHYSSLVNILKEAEQCKAACIFASDLFDSSLITKICSLTYLPVFKLVMDGTHPKENCICPIVYERYAAETAFRFMFPYNSFIKPLINSVISKTNEKYDKLFLHNCSGGMFEYLEVSKDKTALAIHNNYKLSLIDIKDSKFIKICEIPVIAFSSTNIQIFKSSIPGQFNILLFSKSDYKTTVAEYLKYDGVGISYIKTDNSSLDYGYCQSDNITYLYYLDKYKLYFKKCIFVDTLQTEGVSHSYSLEWINQKEEKIESVHPYLKLDICIIRTRGKIYIYNLVTKAITTIFDVDLFVVRGTFIYVTFLGKKNCISRYTIKTSYENTYNFGANIIAFDISYDNQELTYFSSDGNICVLELTAMKSVQIIKQNKPVKIIKYSFNNKTISYLNESKELFILSSFDV